MLAVVALLASVVAATSARLHSLPEDTHAFPKYRVAFLNALPVLNDTAQRWLANGLRGGEPEFLDQPWKDDASRTPPHRKEIGTADTPDPLSSATRNYTLEHIRMGPKDSYLCLIPKPSESALVGREQQDEAETELTPAKSWSLLQPLSGTCLYHRQGWFTYSYCHNKDIRQFKELAQSQPRLPAGTYKPVEDPEWESYTLGRAPRSSEEPGADLTVAERNAQAANLELARNAGSRYLVQRWADGTVCDKTGKSREVEVQFHCSMVMTDHILFVKETKTCAYVLVIHTPRLCAEPGFRSRRDSGEETPIRCREVVDRLDGQQQQLLNLPITDHPLKVPRRKTVLPAPLKGQSSKDKASTGASAEDGTGTVKSKEDMYNDLLKKTLEALVAKVNGGEAAAGGGGRGGRSLLKGAEAVRGTIENGELILEFIDETEEDGEDNNPSMDASQRFVDSLRAAGYDVRAEVISTKLASKQGEKKDSSPKSGGQGGKRESKSKPKAPPKVLQGHHLEL